MISPSDPHLEHRHERVAVGAEDAGRSHGGRAEHALDARRAHRAHEHPRQPKRHALGERVALLRDLEAVAKVDVHDLRQARAARRGAVVD